MSEGYKRKIDSIVDKIVDGNLEFNKKAKKEQESNKNEINESIVKAIAGLNSRGKKVVLDELSAIVNQRSSTILDKNGNINISDIKNITKIIVNTKLEEAKREGIDLIGNMEVSSKSNFVPKEDLSKNELSDMVKNYANLSEKEKEQVRNNYENLSLDDQNYLSDQAREGLKVVAQNASPEIQKNVNDICRYDEMHKVIRNHLSSGEEITTDIKEYYKIWLSEKIKKASNQEEKEKFERHLEEIENGQLSQESRDDLEPIATQDSKNSMKKNEDATKLLDKKAILKDIKDWINSGKKITSKKKKYAKKWIAEKIKRARNQDEREQFEKYLEEIENEQVSQESKDEWNGYLEDDIAEVENKLKDLPKEISEDTIEKLKQIEQNKIKDWIDLGEEITDEIKDYIKRYINEKIENTEEQEKYLEEIKNGQVSQELKDKLNGYLEEDISKRDKQSQNTENQLANEILQEEKEKNERENSLAFTSEQTNIDNRKKIEKPVKNQEEYYNEYGNGFIDEFSISDKINEVNEGLKKSNFSDEHIQEAFSEYKKFIEGLEQDDIDFLAEQTNEERTEMLQSVFSELEVNAQTAQILDMMAGMTFGGKIREILIDSEKRESFLAELGKVADRGIEEKQGVQQAPSMDDMMTQFFGENAVDLDVSAIEAQSQTKQVEKQQVAQPQVPPRRIETSNRTSIIENNSAKVTDTLDRTGVEEDSNAGDTSDTSNNDSNKTTVTIITMNVKAFVGAVVTTGQVKGVMDELKEIDSMGKETDTKEKDDPDEISQ